MKQLLTVAGLCLFFIACNNDKPADAPPADDSVKVKTASTPLNEKDAKIEALKKTTPLSLERLKELMPAEADSSRQTNFNSSMQWGYAYASADYPKKSHSLKIEFYDCAGNEGSNYYAANFADKLSKPDANTTVIDFMGSKALESYDKQMNYATLTYMAGGRLLVQLQGKKMNTDQLRSIAQQINIKP